MNALATTEAAAVVAAGDQVEAVVMLPFEQLHDSPTNQRETYTNIEQLTADIKSAGRIMSPLRVRRRMVKAGDAWVQDGFEIIFGHRRKRAGIAAGLAGAPCIITEASDAEALAMQVGENLSRQDVHAFEEAKGFAQLIQTFGRTPAQIAEQFGKSESHVRGRLALLQAHPDVRKACLAGEILPTVALLIARLRVESLQTKALARIKAKYLRMEDGGSKSFREIRNLLVDEFTLDIKKAFFDADDVTLLAAAGACSACPKRSGNAPEYADLLQPTPSPWGGTSAPAGPNLCTDPDCFASKKKAHLTREAEALKRDGYQVVTGTAARGAVGADGKVKGAYIAAKSVKAEVNAVQGKKPGLMLIQDPRTGEVSEAYKVADLKAAGVKAADAAPASGHSARQEQQRKESERNEAKAKQLTQQNIELLKAVRSSLADKPLQEFDARLMAEQLLHQTNADDSDVVVTLWGCDSEDSLRARIATMTTAEALQLARDCVLARSVTVHGYWLNRPETAQNLKTAAAHYGITVAAPAPVRAAKPAKAASTKAATAVKYRCPATGQTWTGRGLKPKWVTEALESGKTLADLEAAAAAAAPAKKAAKKPAPAAPQAAQAFPAGAPAAAGAERTALSPAIAWPFPTETKAHA